MLTPKVCEQARLARDPRFDGLFFILVKTTKIFCRNTCKVRLPLEKNVHYSASAHEALSQGYRPCLRCRPDSAPNSFAWQGVNTSVKRALSLLTQRLDASIESIASSLGITTRYLNKLFRVHMHISAKRYRIYQQVLMAKQLLQQTQLPVEQVACSVGFSSARQLQHHVKNHLRLSPSQLRKNLISNQAIGNKQAHASIDLTETVTLLLAYRPPYNWPQVRDFFAKRQIHGNELVCAQSITKIVTIPTYHDSGLSAQTNTAGKTSAKVDIRHDAKQHGFYISFNARHSQHTLAIVSIVRRMLDLDANPQLISQAIIKAGLPENKLVNGLRIPGVASEFEAGCRAILGQQVSVAAAVNKVNELHVHFAQAKGISNLICGFPSPAEVAKSDLLFLKIPAARRQTLIALAAYYQAKHDLSSSPSSIIEIKGIGPWTVNYVAMRALGETDVWLDTDLVIKQQKVKLEAGGHTLLADNAAPWRSYLTLQLWSIA